MKKLFNIALMCAAAMTATAFVSCDPNNDGKDDDDTVYNEFAFDGRTYDFSAGFGGIEFWGDYYENGLANDVPISLFMNDEENEGDISIIVDMLVPVGKDRPVVGTYTFDDSLEPFTFTYEDEYSYVELNNVVYEDDEDDEEFAMTGGTVKVLSIVGTGDDAVYTIEVDCTLEDEAGASAGSIQGTWRGTLEWYDESESNESRR